MLAAIIKAQSTLEEFLELSESPPEGAHDFAVKVQVEQGEQREYLWVYPISKEPQGFSGRLNGVPESLRGFSEGEEVLFQREDIVDWTYDNAATDTMPALMPPRIVVAGPVSDCWAIFLTGP